jgi:hypothetical protein
MLKTTEAPVLTTETTESTEKRLEEGGGGCLPHAVARSPAAQFFRGLCGRGKSLLELNLNISILYSIPIHFSENGVGAPG